MMTLRIVPFNRKPDLESSRPLKQQKMVIDLTGGSTQQKVSEARTVISTSTTSKSEREFNANFKDTAFSKVQKTAKKVRFDIPSTQPEAPLEPIQRAPSLAMIRIPANQAELDDFCYEAGPSVRSLSPVDSEYEYAVDEDMVLPKVSLNDAIELLNGYRKQNLLGIDTQTLDILAKDLPKLLSFSELEFKTGAQKAEFDFRLAQALAGSGDLYRAIVTVDTQPIPSAVPHLKPAFLQLSILLRCKRYESDDPIILKQEIKQFEESSLDPAARSSFFKLIAKTLFDKGEVDLCLANLNKARKEVSGWSNEDETFYMNLTTDRISALESQIPSADGNEKYSLQFLLAKLCWRRNSLGDRERSKNTLINLNRIAFIDASLKKDVQAVLSSLSKK